ncbi:hypothetical protein PG985_011042 [Apiospora marii]|uniref:Uncharacterized protein n=1 Tax=Apiospora marii TaxID=335849 RepID=A0ABR1STY9_9PEZI
MKLHDRETAPRMPGCVRVVIQRRPFHQLVARSQTSLVMRDVNAVKLSCTEPENVVPGGLPLRDGFQQATPWKQPCHFNSSPTLSRPRTPNGVYARVRRAHLDAHSSLEDGGEDGMSLTRLDTAFNPQEVHTMPTIPGADQYRVIWRHLVAAQKLWMYHMARVAPQAFRGEDSFFILDERVHVFHKGVIYAGNPGGPSE